MRKVLLLTAAALLLAGPAVAPAAETKVPAGTENLVLDSMSKGKQKAGKKVLKGPVPFAHQAHVDAGVKCYDCHHKQKEGETPKPCHECHKELKGDTPKESDAFHCGAVETMPALQSCVGCHSRTVAGTKATKAPLTREPCDACHSLLKK
ncbi:MAG TPA: cytochrome c3 family protein [bacterium]